MKTTVIYTKNKVCIEYTYKTLKHQRYHEKLLRNYLADECLKVRTVYNLEEASMQFITRVSLAYNPADMNEKNREELSCNA